MPRKTARKKSTRRKPAAKKTASRVTPKTRTRTKTVIKYRTRRARNPINITSTRPIKSMQQTAVVSLLGALGAGVSAGAINMLDSKNKIPPGWRGMIQALSGAGTVWAGRKNEMVQAMGIGAGIAGTISSVRGFFPDTPFLLGGNTVVQKRGDFPVPRVQKVNPIREIMGESDNMGVNSEYMGANLQFSGARPGAFLTPASM